MIKLGVIFGGVSYEHEISIISAISLKNIFTTELNFVFCDKDRNFYHIEAKNMNAKYFSQGEYKKSKSLNIGKNGFYLSGFLSKNKINCDVFINLIHGADGEDGKIAALFDFYDIDYIGPRLEASVMSYSKELTKLLSAHIGVKTLNFQVISRKDHIKFEYPVIIKPSHLGSSIGLSVAHHDKELEYALDVAFEFDDTIVVEPFIAGIKEYNLAGCKIDNEMIYSIIEEPAKKKILDFDQKYMDFARSGKAQEADIEPNLAQKMRDAFDKIYSFGFEGAVIRCDFFVLDNEIYLNEINPNPGSLANYLFDDFENMIYNFSKNLPKSRKILIKYQYINQITSAK